MAQRRPNDLADAQMRRERREGVLEHDLGGAAEIAFLAPIHRGDIDPVEADHASREFLQPERGAAERRLARAAGAAERDDLATAHRDVDAVDPPLGRASADKSQLAALCAPPRPEPTPQGQAAA